MADIISQHINAYNALYFIFRQTNLENKRRSYLFTWNVNDLLK